MDDMDLLLDNAPSAAADVVPFGSPDDRSRANSGEGDLLRGHAYNMAAAVAQRSGDGHSSADSIDLDERSAPLSLHSGHGSPASSLSDTTAGRAPSSLAAMAQSEEVEEGRGDVSSSASSSRGLYTSGDASISDSDDDDEGRRETRLDEEVEGGSAYEDDRYI